jgi:hypothetical protein
VTGFAGREPVSAEPLRRRLSVDERLNSVMNVTSCVCLDSMGEF